MANSAAKGTSAEQRATVNNGVSFQSIPLGREADESQGHAAQTCLQVAVTKK